MGKRRMFSKDIVRSDAFLDLPISSQALYFHLGMDTDDRGYISNAKSIIRLVGASQGDLEPLIIKGFVMVRGDSLLLQKHFKINNIIRSDRFVETTYLEDFKRLFLEDNGGYTEDASKGKKIVVDTIGIPNDNQVTTQDKISKDNLSKFNLSNTNSKPGACARESAGWLEEVDNYLSEFKKTTTYDLDKVDSIANDAIEYIAEHLDEITSPIKYFKVRLAKKLESQLGKSYFGDSKEIVEFDSSLEDDDEEV